MSKGRLAAGVTACVLLCTGVLAAPVARAEDPVGQAQERLSALEAEANQNQIDLQRSREAQLAAQAEYELTTADLADQRALVDQLRVQVGRVAVAAHQQSATMGTASLLFTAESEDSFLADMKVMQSVTALTDEQMARLGAEQDRLADLEAAQAEALDRIASEIEEQERLSAEYQGRIDSAQMIVGALSASQKAMLESRVSQSVIEANLALLNSALTEGASRASRDGSFDATGPGLRPTSGAVTSPFGYRVNPIGGYSELHDGLDIAPPCGTAVVASWTGVVLSARSESGWGNRIVVDSGTYKAAYNHLQAMNVAPGDVVTAGQVIGSVGSTGYSTGCHLHFSTWVNGQITDPATIIVG